MKKEMFICLMLVMIVGSLSGCTGEDLECSACDGTGKCNRCGGTG